MSLGRSLVLAYNGLRDPFYAKFSVAWICDPCVTESGDRPCANQWSSTLTPRPPLPPAGEGEKERWGDLQEANVSWVEISD